VVSGICPQPISKYSRCTKSHVTALPVGKIERAKRPAKCHRESLWPEQRFPKPLQPILACSLQFRFVQKFKRF
jgi:hypothetical protein